MEFTPETLSSWVTLMQTVLKDKAQNVYSALPVDISLMMAILKAYEMVPGATM